MFANIGSSNEPQLFNLDYWLGVGITTLHLIFHGPYSSLCLPRWFRVKLGVNKQEPQNVNIHGKCGMKIFYNRSLKRKWPRLLKGWNLFSDKGKFWFDHYNTRWMYANLQAIQAIRGFVKHQTNNAPTINNQLVHLRLWPQQKTGNSILDL